MNAYSLPVRFWICFRSVELFMCSKRPACIFIHNLFTLFTRLTCDQLNVNIPSDVYCYGISRWRIRPYEITGLRRPAILFNVWRDRVHVLTFLSYADGEWFLTVWNKTNFRPDRNGARIVIAASARGRGYGSEKNGAAPTSFFVAANADQIDVLVTIRRSCPKSNPSEFTKQQWYACTVFSWFYFFSILSVQCTIVIIIQRVHPFSILRGLSLEKRPVRTAVSELARAFKNTRDNRGGVEPDLKS
jgi:hypothetical protein